jgi:hypothetical protein
MTILAGCLMILAALLVFYGKIFQASIIYQLPNSIFLYLGITNKDYIGSLFVGIGILLGLMTIWKMHTGKLNKGL